MHIPEMVLCFAERSKREGEYGCPVDQPSAITTSCPFKSSRIRTIKSRFHLTHIFYVHKFRVGR